jgi:hypothetical protein
MYLLNRKNIQRKSSSECSVAQKIIAAGNQSIYAQQNQRS